VKVTVTNAQNRVIVNDDTNVVTVEDAATTVTVSETGPQGPAGAGGADGYYGQFYDTTDQVAASTTVAYPVKLNSVDAADGVSVEANGSGNPTRITFGYQGTYNVQFSLQFVNTASQDAHINVWFRLDGTDIPDSNSQYTVPQKHGSDDGALIAALNFLVDVTANQYVEIMWQTENTAISLQTLPAGTTPTTPATPSAIVTATQVMYTQVGPQGPAGQGVPTGGTTGQVLTKSSATNYDTAWATPATPGLVLIKSQAVGSNVATVTITNAFSATYRAYRILWTGGTVSGFSWVNFHLGSSVGTAYYGNRLAQRIDLGTINAAAALNKTYWEGATVGDTNQYVADITLYDPFATRRTHMTSVYFEVNAASPSTSILGVYNGMLMNTTSYTDFTFRGNLSNTMTGGTIYVYGITQ